MANTGISFHDLNNASDIISRITLRQICFESILPEPSNDADFENVGSHFNQWRRPVTDYGRNNPGWEFKLKASRYVGDIDFVRKEWVKARDIVDTVLDLLLKEMKSATNHYEGLRIERYVRQGSSREGLKVIAPNEFDTLLLYHIDGIRLTPMNIETNTCTNKTVPEFCTMISTKSLHTIKMSFPRLYHAGVFAHYSKAGPVYLNSRALHQHVFQSIIDQATEKISEEIAKLRIRGRSVTFNITRRMNPPSINLTIHIHILKDGTKIDVDIVPAILLRQDQVADPARPGNTMDCPVYAVFKWTEESSLKASKFNSAEVIWRVCSSGYEKHTIDIARCYRQQRYVITALRILKTYFSKTKMLDKTPPQIVTVLRSYHLKHIAFYTLLHTQYINPGKVQLNGIEDALIYFIRFLMESLKKKCLPHFFHSNRYITYMFPNYPVKPNALRFNLIGHKSEEALNQALMSVRSRLIPDLGFVLVDTDDDQIREEVVSEYTQHISAGDYF